MSAIAQRVRGWWTQIETPSDWLCFTRLMLVPVLWVFALSRKPAVVGAGLAVTAATDVLDGVLSRATGQRSEFGSQFDTVADMAVILSAPGWIAALYPETWNRRKGPLFVMTGTAVALLALEWRKFHKLADLHIDSARASAAFAHLYALNLFTRGRDSDWLFRGFVVMGASAAIETLYVIASREDLQRLSETPLLDALFEAAGLDNPLAMSPFHDPARRAGGGAERRLRG